MMKKIFFAIILVNVVLILARFINTTDEKIVPTTPVVPTEEIIQKATPVKTVSKTIFVPYWNSSVSVGDVNLYDSFIYFGVATDKNGNIVEDAGLENIQSFIRSTDGKSQYLTVRMLDTNTNLEVLENTKAQEKIIQEVRRLAIQHDFEGVVLDLELSALPLEDVKNNISLFTERFAEDLHTNDLLFGMTLYGDTYFRGRPYDVHEIGKYVDTVLIMAYDFHKSRGEPGPNFPLQDDGYGYDYTRMITDFRKDVSEVKITVIFGLYGYDWTLGPQGKPLKAARALTLRNIEEMIKPTCDLQDCDVTISDNTYETVVKYRDDEGYDHALWYEDERSSDKKIEFLKENGIGNVGYWVYGYF